MRYMKLIGIIIVISVSLGLILAGCSEKVADDQTGKNRPSKPAADSKSARVSNDMRQSNPPSRSEETRNVGKVDAKSMSVVNRDMKNIKGPEADGKAAPVFEAKTYDGKTINLKDYQGKIVLLDFWATWCRPCHTEFPHLAKLADTYGGAKNFAIIGVSLDKTPDSVKTFVEKYKLNYPHVYDGQGWNNAVAKLYGVRSIPHTVIIDKNGNIVQRGLRGDMLVKTIEKMINEDKS